MEKRKDDSGIAVAFICISVSVCKGVFLYLSRGREQRFVHSCTAAPQHIAMHSYCKVTKTIVFCWYCGTPTRLLGSEVHW